MALFHATYQSVILGKRVNYMVILPEPPRNKDEALRYYNDKSIRYKTIYLLHGHGGNEWDWIRQSAIERYVTAKNIAVVLPCAETSCYVNGPQFDYCDFIGKELVAVTRFLFPLSDKREDTFIAGVSMGGYGALHTLFTFPDVFAEGASFSGVVDIVKTIHRDRVPGSEVYRDLGNAFGFAGTPENGPNDLCFLVRKLQDEGCMPHFWMSTGTEDPLYENTSSFRSFLENRNIDFTYKECSGIHSWDVFDQHCRQWLDLMFPD